METSTEEVSGRLIASVEMVRGETLPSAGFSDVSPGEELSSPAFISV